MKNSGIPWIGDIPIGWEIDTIGNLYTLRNEKVSDKDYPPLSVTKMGIVPQLETAAKTDDGDNRKLVRVGDFAINSRSDRRGSCGISAYDGSVSLINTVITPREQMNPRFYNWLFHSELFADEFYKWGHGIVDDLWTTRWQEMKRISIVAPSLEEQQKIASFLDRKCAEIDEMIALQEKIVEELKAYKQSVITEAVTKGLNPDAPMKDSGIDWIGEIPEHWETTKFKALFQIKKIIAGELGYDVLSVTQQGLRVKDLSKNEGQVAQDYSKYQLVDIDDFVMNHMDLLTGYIDCAKVSGVTSPDYRTFVNRNDSVAYNPFYLRIFQKCYKDKTFYHLGQGVSFLGRWRLPKEQLNAFVLPLPSLDEQKVIAEYLDTKCTEIDNLISIKLSKIDSLKEYKKSIIYEYVTRKKEVIE